MQLPAIMYILIVIFFFFNDTAPTEIYTLYLHDALPICDAEAEGEVREVAGVLVQQIGEHRDEGGEQQRDRKSTRLNSSHVRISYAVFCLKKKKNKKYTERSKHHRLTRV